MFAQYFIFCRQTSDYFHFHPTSAKKWTYPCMMFCVIGEKSESKGMSIRFASVNDWFSRCRHQLKMGVLCGSFLKGFPVKKPGAIPVGRRCPAPVETPAGSGVTCTPTIRMWQRFAHILIIIIAIHPQEPVHWRSDFRSMRGDSRRGPPPKRKRGNEMMTRLFPFSNRGG